MNVRLFLGYAFSLIVMVMLLMEGASCCRDREDLPLYKPTESEMSWQIYRAYNVLIFRNQVGEIQANVVSAVNTEEFTDGGGGLQCGIYRTQSIKVSFIRQDTIQNYFEIRAGTPDGTAYAYINWEGVGGYIPIDEIDNGNHSFNDYVTWYDTLKVGPKLYFDVMKFERSTPVDSTTTLHRSLYYNKPNGVIRYDQDDIIWLRQ